METSEDALDLMKEGVESIKLMWNLEEIIPVILAASIIPPGCFSVTIPNNLINLFYNPISLN